MSRSHFHMNKVRYKTAVWDHPHSTENLEVLLRIRCCVREKNVLLIFHGRVKRIRSEKKSMTSTSYIQNSRNKSPNTESSVTGAVRGHERGNLEIQNNITWSQALHKIISKHLQLAPESWFYLRLTQTASPVESKLHCCCQMVINLLI